MRVSKPALIFMIVAFPVGLVGGAYVGRHVAEGDTGGGIGLLGIVAVIGFVLLMALAVRIVLSNKQGARLTGPELDAARELRAPPGKARVFIVRKGFVASQQGINFSVGGYEGQMRAGFMLVADVDPGTVTVSARFNKQPESTRATHVLTLGAGEIALVQVGVQSGMVRVSPYFEDIGDRDDMRDLVAKAKPIAWLKTPAGPAATAGT